MLLPQLKPCQSWKLRLLRKRSRRLHFPQPPSLIPLSRWFQDLIYLPHCSRDPDSPMPLCRTVLPEHSPDHRLRSYLHSRCPQKKCSRSHFPPERSERFYFPEDPQMHPLRYSPPPAMPPSVLTLRKRRCPHLRQPRSVTVIFRNCHKFPRSTLPGTVSQILGSDAL